MAYYQCPKCGQLVEEHQNFCIRCGTPIVIPKKAKPNYGWIIALIILGILGYAAIYYAGYAKIQNYKASLSEAIVEIYNSADKAEDIALLTSKVWQNSINRTSDEETDRFTKRDDGQGSFYNDYHDALEALRNSKDYKEDIKWLKDNRNTVSEMIQNLSSPPSEMEDDYKQLRKFYTAYTEYLTYVTNNHEDDYDTYVDTCNDLVQALIKEFNPISFYVELTSD